MEKVIHSMSAKIAAYMMYDEDKKSVIEYGLLAVTNIIIIAILVTVIGFVFHIFYESIILFIGVGVLKKSTGGAHSQTMFGCVIISVVSITGLALLSRYILGFPLNKYLSIGISSLIFLVCSYVFYKLVPVDTPNKPIKNPLKIKRLRKQSYIILGLYTAFTIVISFFASNNERIYSFVNCVHFVLLWQTFMLTKAGGVFIKSIDPKFQVKEVK